MNFNDTSTERYYVEVDSQAHLNCATGELFGDPDLRHSIAERYRADNCMHHGVRIVDANPEDVVFDDALIMAELLRGQQSGR